jgi:hypothetical protein
MLGDSVSPGGREEVVKLERLDGDTVDTGPEMVVIWMTVDITSATEEDLVILRAGPGELVGAERLDV